MGTSTARTNFYNTTTYGSQLLIEQAGSAQADYAQAAFVRNSNNSNGSEIIIGKSRGTTVNSSTVVQAADTLGVIRFQGADGTNMVVGAEIVAAVDSTPGADDMPTALTFRTTADGASTSTERVRIDSSGRLLVGTSSTSKQTRAIFQGNSAGSATSEILFAADTNSPTGGLANLYFSDNGHNNAAIIACVRDGGTWTSGSSHPVSLQFYTAANGSSSPTERMRINNAGRLGVGQTTPAYKFDLYGGSDSTVANFESSGGDVYIRFKNSTGGNGYVGYEGTDLTIWAANAANSSSTRVARFDADGVKFGDDTAAANALSDYEEGTFTPAFQSGITSPTFSSQSANYTKIGSLVTFTIHMQLTGGTNTSSGIIITDLPFTANASKEAGSATFAFNSGLSNDSGWPTDNNPTLYVGPSSNKIYFYAVNGGTWNGNTAGGLAGRNMHIAGFYYV